MGSKSPEANIMVPKPSRLTSSTSPNTTHVLHKKPCKGKKLNDNCELELSVAVQSAHQTLKCEDIFQPELKQGKIPPYILSSKMNCVDYVKCSHKNGTQFGFIPLTPLRIYTGKQSSNQSIHNIVDLHHKVKASSCRNFMACRIPLQSQLNINNWRKYLVEYWDQQLVDLLDFGFPLDFDHEYPLQPTETNHASAVAHAEHIDKYLQDEMKFGVIYCPFDSKPFPLHVSPFMTREKSGTNKCRAIVDLSWPHGFSVNAGVAKHNT